MKKVCTMYCGNCDSECRITYQAVEGCVVPQYCPFCSEPILDDDETEWPVDEEA